jgi:MFS family permease
VLGLVTTYILVAVSSAVDAAVDGIELEAREALADARECSGPIVGWVAIELAALIGAWLIGKALGAPWFAWVAILIAYFATLFVVPMLAVERVGPGEAIAESLRLIRERWRQALGGLLGIFFFILLGSYVGWSIIRHADALHRQGDGKQYGLAIAGIVVLTVVNTVARVTGEAFATLLLRDGLGELPGAPPWRVRRSRQARLVRGTAFVLLVFALLGGVGALTKSDRRTLQASEAPGNDFVLTLEDPQAVTIDGGAPVMYDHREVGTVLGSQLEEEKLRISFHVEPGIGPQSTPSVGQVRASAGAGPYLELLPSAGGGASEAQPL